MKLLEGIARYGSFMVPRRSLESMEWAARMAPHAPQVVQDAYAELLWAVLRGELDQALALQDALAGLAGELRRAAAA